MKENTQVLDIYGNRKANYENELAKLKECVTSQRNKDLLMQWHNYLFATSSGKLRVTKLNSQMRKIVLQLGKDLDHVTSADIEALIALYNRTTSWREATRADYRRAIKQFYAWFQEHDTRLDSNDRELRKTAQKLYEYLKKHVSRSYAIERINYSEVITEDDLRKVIEKGCAHIKEKAFLMVLHEGGLRAGEILNMKIGDLQVFDDRVLVQVTGKTGRRRVPLVLSMGYLMRWLDEHPFKDNQQAYLWAGDSMAHRFQPIKHGGAQKLIDRCFKRAGVTKRHNLHWFRHSRASLLAPHLKEAMLCEYFGWTQGSRQVRTYVHADISQVEDAVFRMHGMARNEEEAPKVMRCFGCSLVNDVASRYCKRCGKPLSTQTAIQEKEYLGTAFEMLQKIMTSPDLKKKFEEYKKTTEAKI